MLDLMKNFLFLCAGLVIGFQAKVWIERTHNESSKNGLVAEIDEKIAELQNLVEN
jgi:hypothetical protein